MEFLNNGWIGLYLNRNVKTELSWSSSLADWLLINKKFWTSYHSNFWHYQARSVNLLLLFCYTLEIPLVCSIFLIGKRGKLLRHSNMDIIVDCFMNDVREILFLAAKMHHHIPSIQRYTILYAIMYIISQFRLKYLLCMETMWS